MYTKNITKVIETGNQEMLVGKKVKTIGYDVIGNYYIVGDYLEILNVTGSMLKVKNDSNSVFLVNIKKVELIDGIKLPTFCISCNTMYRNSHKSNCATMNINSMIEENKIQHFTRLKKRVKWNIYTCKSF